VAARFLDCVVIVFDTAEDEHVVSVEHIGEEENGNGG
jgi:DNA gyrase subunit A